MEETLAKEKKFNKLITIVSIVVPIVVAILFGVKIPNVERLGFLPPIYASINGLTAVLLLVAVWAIKNGKKKLWSGLADKYNSNVDTMEEQIIAKRIMHRQALEGFRCLDEGVLLSATDGDVGAVLGLGFPIYTGGYLSYIDYVGMNNFIKDCDEFKEKFGPRWEVPTSLRALAKAGKSIHEFK